MNAVNDKTEDTIINDIISSTEIDDNNYMGFRGQFGWGNYKDINIPFILRESGKYCAARMVEIEMVKFLCQIRPDIYRDCVNIPSYHITEQERLLLTEINSFHCNYQYGYSDFTLREVLVPLEDVIQLYHFLEVCIKLTDDPPVFLNCGFIQIQASSIVPYVKLKDQRYFPHFYFDGVQSFQFKNSLVLTGWDLSYLKLCFKIQQIRNEFIKQQDCIVINVDEVKQLFEQDVEFADYWQEAWSKDIKNEANTYKPSPSTVWYQKPKL